MGDLPRGANIKGGNLGQQMCPGPFTTLNLLQPHSAFHRQLRRDLPEIPGCRKREGGTAEEPPVRLGNAYFGFIRRSATHFTPVLVNKSFRAVIATILYASNFLENALIPRDPATKCFGQNFPDPGPRKYGPDLQG